MVVIEINWAGLVRVDAECLSSGLYSDRLVKVVNSQTQLIMVNH